MVVGELTEETQLLVIGGGPGGYVAAFKAADLGLSVTLVDENAMLGGVCLREGCIPSKALLHVADLVVQAADARRFGVRFNKPRIDVDQVRAWKDEVVSRLCGGINTLARKRSVNVVRGRAVFEDSRTVRIEGQQVGRIRFKHAILATGSRVVRLPEKVLPPDCCLDSTAALELEKVPKTLLVVGGGFIGLELGQVYAGLGSQVTVMEMLDQIAPGADADLVRVLASRLKKQFAGVLTSARLEGARRTAKGIEVTYSHKGQTHTALFETVLSSVGRRPNTDDLGLEHTRVQLDDRGFVKVDAQRRTSDKRIFAIGDITGNPMLAHKASHEGIVAAEVIAGDESAVFEPRAIPSVVYTSPELAWCGLTEQQAAEQGRAVKVGKFLWGACGRAIATGHPEGLTKVIADPETHAVLGVGIVGQHAGDLIAEAALAIEMGAVVEDLALTIHPHPSTSETVMEAAESVFGRAIHMLR